ncbi:chemotaxis protein [Corynebacterium kefirresidentii]|uniref:Chemotaxis protein n=1 Tax=Corynebacterium kefirresidentii TaxID=1979527 RepID=A0ABT8Q6X1_9CORY|nr:chemotaxis protein [Corynebacterium kefirresidentii]MDN8620573.1 chemotaxis protein [Corynebacterium kefirresidentii]MDN8642019.1 chemotaxis protein [Corynebacterium kefirresidentii]
MLILIAMVIAALAVIKKLDDIDKHLKELLASQEDDETPC